jgi:hypothetical protein
MFLSTHDRLARIVTGHCSVIKTICGWRQRPHDHPGHGDFLAMHTADGRLTGKLLFAGLPVGVT